MAIAISFIVSPLWGNSVSICGRVKVDLRFVSELPPERLMTTILTLGARFVKNL